MLKCLWRYKIYKDRSNKYLFKMTLFYVQLQHKIVLQHDLDPWDKAM